jgi:hypothetical protein
MHMRSRRTRSIGIGAAAGLVGGLVSGVLLQFTRMTTLDGATAPAMRLVADAAHVTGTPAGWIAYLVYTALLGAIFGWLLASQEVGEGSGIVWGALYGGVWWIVSGLVIIPVLHGVGPLTPAAVDLIRGASFPWFAAMVVDGAFTGGIYAVAVHQRRLTEIETRTTTTRRAA